MAPGRKKMAATTGPPRNWKPGDLVLAKVRGFPPWPAKVAVPEEHDMSPRPSKVFVQFFGSWECAYVRHAEVFEFTPEIRVTMEEKVRTGAVQKQFTNAVQQICLAIDQVKQVAENQTERLTGTQSDSPSIADVGATQSSMEKAEDAANCPGFQAASDVVPQSPVDQDPVESCTPGPAAVQDGVEADGGAASTPADMELDAPECLKETGEQDMEGRDEDAETLEHRQHDLRQVEDRVENVEEVEDRTRTEAMEDSRKNLKEMEDRVENVDEVEDRTSAENMEDRGKNVKEIESRVENVEAVEVKARAENVEQVESTAIEEVAARTEEQIVQKMESDAEIVETMEGQAENEAKARKGEKDHGEAAAQGNEEGAPKVLKTFERRKKRVVKPAEEQKEAVKENEKSEMKKMADKEVGAKALKSNGVLKSEKETVGKADLKSERKRPRPDEAEGKQEKKKKKLKRSSPDDKEEKRKSNPEGPEKTFVKKKEKHRVISDSEASPSPKRLKSTKAESSKLGKAETSKLMKRETPKVAKETKAETKGESTKTSKSDGAKSAKREGTKGAKVAKAEGARKTEGAKVAKAGSPAETPKVETGKADTGKVKLKIETKQELKVSVSMKKPGSAVKPSDLGALSTPVSSKYASEAPNKVREAVEAAKEMKQRIAQKEEASSATMKYLKAKTTKALNAESPMFLLPSPDAISSPERHHKLEKHGSIGSKSRSSSSSRDVERSAALDIFQNMLESLTRAKDSILKATRYAMECANKGFAKQVMDVIMKKLKNEKDNRKRVDLLFLVDSMTQYNHHKGGRDQASSKGGYAPIVEACLSRFISAVAPPNSSNENHRQCMKVVNLWMDRKIMDQSVLKDTMSSLHIAAGLNTSQRQYQKENQSRAVDDPLRGMDDMVVDEYGSNTGFQMPGLLARQVDDEEEEEEAAAPTGGKAMEDETMKHRVVLEDLEGELEMEDVSPTSNGNKASPLLPTGQEAVTTMTPPPPLPASPPPPPPPPPGV